MSATIAISEQQSMQCLVAAVQEMSLARSLDSVMRIVRTAARRLTGADGATFVLRDHNMCYYADEDAIAPLWKGQRFPMSICISGWSMLNRRPAIIEDIYQDSRIPVDAYRPTFVKSLLMVPVRSMDPIAAIGNYWAHKHIPSEEEISLLQSLADITAVNMENIQVYNELELRVKERTQELIDSLEREKKMNAVKSRMVSMASHELKTPLTTILSSTDLLEYQIGEDTEGKKAKHIDRIKSSAKRLTAMLNDFLAADQLEQGKAETYHETFDLAAFAAEITDEISGTLKRGQKLRHMHEGATEIVQDRKILRHILLNLLSNASKYSGEHQPIDLHTVVTPSQVTISVRDYGIGIPLEDQQRIFSDYFRASNVYGIQGTGLGLNIVKYYTELLGGTISFYSTPGEGTSFKLSFMFA
ncbi:GAF domain-containing protein [Chitinophaga agrisoli]|uniref:histidine kinase n=1 Tax=Chitinophaga agrisoli TaxID=2607653 RepID=A0A5B2VXS6_9BACT|nr:GAF domain-containing sensor histidine kinase [Chitinophaga agrisoli]KAA2242966.1 GAF domain-containing protein [Chitinophaga agrisoli]